MKNTLLAFALLLLPLAGKAQETPAAQSVMKLAYKQADKEKKNVLLMFHASWCGWCKKMDKAIQDESCKKFFEDNYVITHLTTMEGKDKKNLENAGADALMEQWGGAGKGLPFWVILDKNGNMLANALLPNGENTGCPASAAEVEAFISALSKTSNLSKENLEVIAQRFRKNASR